jgi:hypothetical protein
MQLFVRSKRIEVGSELREELAWRLYFALGRFRDLIREVREQLSMSHGPGGEIFQPAFPR